MHIQAEILHERRCRTESCKEAEQNLYGPAYRTPRPAMRLDTCELCGRVEDDEKGEIHNGPFKACSCHSAPNTRDLTSCFLRLANFDNGVFDRLNRYESALWRQIAQVLLLLRAAHYRWPARLK
jgi:hypothetical protein